MSLFLSILLLVAGFVFLIKGADWLVDGSSSIAKAIGMSDLMIGLTIVAFGTSMPELLVNIIASFQGSSDIAIGNVVGSNIANTFLVVGLASLMGVLVVESSTVWKEIPFSILASIALFVVLNDVLIDGINAPQILTRSEGIILLLFFFIFLYYTFGLKREKGIDSEDTEKAIPLMTSFSLVAIGCIALPLGGKFVVDASSTLALALGFSEAFIGLSLVALGTSLPEAVTACVAVKKGKMSIAVGNVIGSNIFNIFWILGLSAVIRPIPFNPALNFDLIIVIISAILLFTIIQHGPLYKRIFFFWKRPLPQYNILKHEGILLLVAYVTYIAFIGWRG